MLLQIRHELRNVVWPTVAGAKVFNTRNVRVFAGIADKAALPGSFPFVLLGQESGVADPDDPEFLTQSFRILTASMVLGDPLGEQALAGGPAPDLGKSAGRSVHELEERVRAAVGKLTGADGAKIMLSTSSLGSPIKVDVGRHLVVSEMSVEALCTSDLAYAAPQQIAEAATIWTWEGVHVSDRFDFFQYRLGFKTGSTPAATVGDLDTTIYTGTAPTFTQARVAGRTYSVFGEYSARKGTGATAADGTSAGDEVGAHLVT